MAEKGISFVNDINTVSALLREINTYFEKNGCPLLIMSYNKAKENFICEATLPEEIGIMDADVNMKFNNVLKSYNKFGEN